MPGYMLRNNQTGHPVMGEIGPRRTAGFIGWACRWEYLICLCRIMSTNHTPNHTQMKTAVRLGAISPITGCPIWYDGIRKPGMRIHCALSAAPQQFKQA